MYIAERPLKVTEHGPNGERLLRTIPVGEKVPVVEHKWSYPIIVAHLNHGLMRWEDEDGVDHAPHLSHHFLTVDMKGYQNAGRVKPAAPAQPKKEKLKSTVVDDRGRPVKPAPVEPVAVVPTNSLLKCEPCEKTFKNSAGLASHARMKHSSKEA